MDDREIERLKQELLQKICKIPDKKYGRDDKTSDIWKNYAMSNPSGKAVYRSITDEELLSYLRETAKELGVKQNDFIKFLLDKKYIYRDKKGKIMPYASKNDGLFEIKETYNEKTKWSGTQTLVTPKGRETFRLLCV